MTDKKDFNFGKKMLQLKKGENLVTTKTKIDKCAPKHAFLNNIENKILYNIAIFDGRDQVLDIMKKNMKTRLQNKLNNNEKLTEAEKNFIAHENIMLKEKKKMEKIINDHKETFNLEKFQKKQETKKEDEKKKELKRKDKIKKLTIKRNESESNIHLTEEQV